VDYEAYIARLEAECAEAYAVVEQARAKGLDPRLSVEIPLASDLADRTQKLLDFLHPRNTAAQIRELTEENDGNREMVAIQIARIVAAESLIYGENQKCPACKGSGKNTQVSWKEVPCENCDGTGKVIGFDAEVVGKADWRDTLKQYEKEAIKGSISLGASRMATCMYHGICAGLAVLTEGILVAPLDGVVSCRIITNADRSESLAVNYAGPIRSAGGTGQALSVLIADVLRRDFGLQPPQVTFNEVERYKEEVSKYSRGLQYRPSNPQLEVIANNCPVYVDGEGVGNEVTGQRDLERVPTNKVREGMLLVMCEGLVLKAPKILKYVEQLEMDGWDWLKDFVKTGGKSNKIEPNEKYMADVLAGRPIFGLPMKAGGLRLRYGRSRLAGLATTAMHPASMMAIGSFVICGTQMKYERPGKATVATPCDTIQGPYLQFKDGSGKRINSENELKLRAGLLETDEWTLLPTEPDWPIAKVWDIGELLVPVGEFLENNHPLPASPYVSEWHEQVVAEAGLKTAESFNEAWQMSETYGVPLDPKYVPVGIDDVSAAEAGAMAASMALDLCHGVATVPEEHRETVYRLQVDIDSKGVLTGPEAGLILKLIGKVSQMGADELNSLNKVTEISLRDWMSKTFSVEIRPRTTLRIGARMGKPEGSKHREMNPSTHGIWPVGSNVGTKRLIPDAVRKSEKYYTGIRVCPECNEQTWRGVCVDASHPPTETNFVGMVKQTLEAEELWKQAMETTHQAVEPAVKGNKSLGSGEKIPEHLLKAVLRQRNGTSAFRDGTIRFDMVDITMTHFRPDEIGITAEKAVELGYDLDYQGQPVVSDDQVIELMPQDVVVAENCVAPLLAAMRFTDDCLKTMYGLSPFYNLKDEAGAEALVGQLIMGLAPHTSGAVLARIIGTAPVKGHYGHPFYHAAKRRNCDGDIDCIMLLTEGLLNFSRMFLPKNRGGRMDAPLTLTTRIVATEIDKEALNTDILNQYPLEFYEFLRMAEQPPGPKEALKHGIKIVETLTEEGVLPVGKIGFTHDTTDCGAGPRNNPYNTLDSMRRKTLEQFALGEILESVDNIEQASKLIDRHLIRDMRGNLRAYGQQKVRCTKCGESYRRVPVSGKCRTRLDTRKDRFTGETVDIYCPGNLILTVTEGAVAKYDDLMATLIERYGCNEYISGLYSQVSKWVSETFESQELGRQQTLF